MNNYRNDLNPQIIQRLESSPYLLRADAAGRHLRGGVCPGCDKKTLWTWAEKPGQVQCDRTNNCGWTATTKDLFPELFEKLNERYQPTPENPNATADAYMEIMRGLPASKIGGWYQQAKYWHPKGNRGTATVRFTLADGVYWERLIDDVTITDGDTEIRNKNFKGLFKGLWWSPPGMEFNDGDEIHLCEGIIDAISLNLAGLKAVAMMAAGTWPDAAIKPHLGKKITWVFALDNDITGRNFLGKHAKTLADAGEQFAAMISSDRREKQDWNDLYKANKLTEKQITEYRHLGALALADSAKTKARLTWQHNTSTRKLIVSHGNRTYSCSVSATKLADARRQHWAAQLNLPDPDQLTDAMITDAVGKATPAEQIAADEYAFNQAAGLTQIATFHMDFLYFQQPDNGEDGQYFLRFQFANGAPDAQLPFGGKSFGAASDFKKSALHKTPGAQFTGSSDDLDRIYRSWMASAPKVVRTLDFVGYDRDTKTYVFADYAVEAGRVLKLNPESFFQLKKSGIKTTVDIRQQLTTRHDPAIWFDDFVAAFGTKGLVTLAWWTGCLFVEQVRADHSSYPFFELVGEAGSGKSDLVGFLWKLLGKDGESFNPNSSTLPGRTRKMAEVANLPIVFNETDNEDPAKSGHIKKFNWDEQKDLFDGQFGRVTGIKSQDNTTKKPRFKAGLMIVQNIPVVASGAILSRICHLNFDLSHHSYAGKQASDRLKMLPLKQTGGYLLNTITRADAVLSRFKKQFANHYQRLQKSESITLQRIVENHAKISAFADCLQGILPQITADQLTDMHRMIEAMAVDRQQNLNTDHPVVQQFWGQFDYLDSYRRDDESLYSTPLLNHHGEPELKIAINLEHFHAECQQKNLPKIDTAELRRHLPSSRQRKFIENKPFASKLQQRTVRCWIFERPTGER